MKPTIGVIGAGFVGQSIISSFKGYLDILVNDPKFKESVPLEKLVSKSDFIFVCVPTPMGTDSPIDSRILMDVIQRVVVLSARDEPPVIVLKSTATPDVIRQIEEITTRFVYAPEFLREAYATEDALMPALMVMGSRNEEDSFGLMGLYKNFSVVSIPIGHVVFCSAIEASVIKYAINSFLATKVSWMNELHDMLYGMEINGYPVDPQVITGGMSSDPRVGKSHLQVPGPDGKYGFGGTCFPKDSRALLAFSQMMRSEMEVLGQAIELNRRVRPECYREVGNGLPT